MSYKSTLTWKGRAALGLTIVLTAYTHVVVPSRIQGGKLLGGDTIRFLKDELFTKGAVFQDLAGQMLVVLGLYALFFWLVTVLARPGMEPRKWYERDFATVLLTWLAAAWLVLDWHNRLFPFSLWNGVLDPSQTPAAAIAADLLGASWLVYRCVLMARAKLERRREAGRAPALASRLTIVAAVGGISALLPFAWPAFTSHANDAPGDRLHRKRPNVVIIGLDSMRRDFALDAKQRGLPALAELREKSFVQANMMTPLARTFPSWVSILTGRHPREVQARDNNASQRAVDKSRTLAKLLHEQGYRTIFGTDETRFSNIGTDFGFDQVISPKPGIGDFVLGQFGDLPLVNFAVQVPRAERLLPSLVGNRAFAQAYHPERYVRRLQDGIGPATDQPTFLAVHLCIAHWPYYTARHLDFRTSDTSMYQASTRIVDEQLSMLMAMLSQQGYLDDNTLLVVLADHGEGIDSDFGTRPEIVAHGTEGRIGLPFGGHGSTLLAPNQWRIFTFFSGQSVAGPVPSGISTQVGSLEDVAPAILELVGVEPATRHRLEVVSQTLKRPLPPATPRAAVSMETGFRPAGFDLTSPDKKKALEIAKARFQIMDDARLELKADAYERSVAERDLGVTDGTRALIALERAETSLLVAADFGANRWDVYPAERPADSAVENPAMLDQACADSELRHRIESWCVPAADTQGSKASPPAGHRP